MTKNLFSSLVALVLMVFSINTFAQGYTPIRGMGIEAKAVNTGGICLACYNGSLSPVIDADLNNSASMGSFAGLAGGNGISVKNTVETYPAGTITGFNIDTGISIITAEFLSSLTIATYKDGVLQESSTSSTLVSVPAFGGTKNRIFLHFKSTKAFNEVRIAQTRLLSVWSAMNVYYAFAFSPDKMINENNAVCDDIIAGSGVDNNVSGSSQFIAPLSMVNNKERISDGDKNSYGTITMPVGILGSFSIGLLDKDQVYPAGNRAGFVISPDDEGKLLSAEFLKNITVETYLFGQLQDSKTLSDGGGLINIKVLGFGRGKQKVSLTTTKPFNEIRLKVSQTFGANLGTLKVYYAFEEPVSCDCDDKIQTSGSAIQGNVLSGSSWTSGQGLFGLVFSKMLDTNRIVDNNTTNYGSTYIPAASLFSIFSSYVTVQSNTTLPKNTFAGFTLEKSANLIGVSILQNITVALYNNNTFTESFTGTGSLFSGNFFTSDSNKFWVGGKATKPFNRIKIIFASGTGLRFPQEYKIFNAFASLDDDNDGVPNCYDQCPNGDDSIDTNGNGIPDCAEGAPCVQSDKSDNVDSDNDGIKDACDGDSDNDGIPDSIEDGNKNGKYVDDDFEGDTNLVTTLGDGIPNYLDLDSDNDGILDLHESGIPMSIIQQIDADMNGVIDAGVADLNKNGIADLIEDSTKPNGMKYPIADTDGDGIPDFLDIKSNNSLFDLYAIGKSNLDEFGGGFVSRSTDFDADGIMNSVDTKQDVKGAPGSPMSPYAVQAINATSRIIASPSAMAEVAQDVKIYPNPVKAGEVLNLQSANSKEHTNYVIYSAQGQVVKSGNFTGTSTIDTSSLVTGVYIIKVETISTVKSYKVIVK
ncbi:MAG: T9SS type A sorting domain-containing protein [Chryseobacterium sp.]|nr:T9SS type A sorting domain-containing protein [Candidatus Chryseobacterium enterohippi]